MVDGIDTSNTPLSKEVMGAVEKVVLVVGAMTMGTQRRAVTVLGFLCLCWKNAMGPFKGKEESVRVSAKTCLVGGEVDEGGHLRRPLVDVLDLLVEVRSGTCCANAGAIVIGDSGAGYVKMSMCMVV